MRMIMIYRPRTNIIMIIIYNYYIRLIFKTIVLICENLHFLYVSNLARSEETHFLYAWS